VSVQTGGRIAKVNCRLRPHLAADDLGPIGSGAESTIIVEVVSNPERLPRRIGLKPYLRLKTWFLRREQEHAFSLGQPLRPGDADGIRKAANQLALWIDNGDCGNLIFLTLWDSEGQGDKPKIGRPACGKNKMSLFSGVDHVLSA